MDKTFWQWVEKMAKEDKRLAAEQFVKDAEKRIKVIRLLKKKGAIKFDQPIEVRWQ